MTDEEITTFRRSCLKMRDLTSGSIHTPFTYQADILGCLVMCEVVDDCRAGRFNGKLALWLQNPQQFDLLRPEVEPLGFDIMEDAMAISYMKGDDLGALSEEDLRSELESLRSDRRYRDADRKKKKARKKNIDPMVEAMSNLSPDAMKELEEMMRKEGL